MGSAGFQDSARVLLLSTADWDARIQTNNQRIAHELSRSFVVYYVESLGLRAPRLSSILDIQRLASRLVRVVKKAGNGNRRTYNGPPGSSEQVTAQPNVVSPLVLPYHSSAPVRALNRALLRKQVLNGIPGDGYVLWTFNPITYGLEDEASAVVYHCVDLLGANPRIDESLVHRFERKLAADGSIAIASSEPVREHLISMGFENPYLWENVAEVNSFILGSRPSCDRQRYAVYVGNITDFKLDFDLVAQLGRALAAVDSKLLLIGPQLDAARSGFMERLRNVPGLELPGEIHVGEGLEDVLGSARVGVIPYAQNDYTRGVFPLKLFEYLGAGLPVISTPLPSIISHSSPDVLLCRSRREFVEATVDFVRSGSSDEEILRRQDKARNHSWRLRGRQARHLASSLT